MKRILILGTSGSGKSTLARRLSAQLGIPFFASDPFYWEAGWKAASSESVRRQVAGVVCQEAWILDGNFDDERELVWKRAECILWLDYSFATVMQRVIFRNLRWALTKRPGWSGNRMG